MLNIKDKIRNVPNFSKPRIIFRNISTSIKDPEAFLEITNQLYELFKDEHIDYIAAIETRGYLFGTPQAKNIALLTY